MIRKVINKISGGDFSEIDYMNFVLEASASSARFDSVVEHEGDSRYITRGVIHSMLVMPFGSGKTSLFVSVKEAISAHDISFPGLIGTITKEGELIESEVMKAAGKILIIDEFQKLSIDVRNAMNSILEYPHVYTRTLGYRIRNRVVKRGKYYRVVAKRDSNMFEIYSRFSCIAGGMYVNTRKTISKAWFSRFIPIRMHPSVDWYEKLSRGEKIIFINPKLRELKFEFNNYLDFHSIYWDLIKSSDILKYFSARPEERGYLVRCLQDLVRLSAFVASLDNSAEINDEYMVSLSVLPNILASYIFSDLDEVDMCILNKWPNLNQTELASEFGLTQAAISTRIRVLKEEGLLGLKTGIFDKLKKIIASRT